LHEVGCLSDSSLKGFYHRSDARLIPPDTTAGRQSVVTSVLFRGYPPELISEWCCVTLETAKRWKLGESMAPPPALRLFELYRQCKVLASPAWAGWEVKGDVLRDPEGNDTPQGHLRAYYFVWQLAAELARDTPEARERLEQIQRAAAG
jgi:hypothetical protein